MLSSMFQRLGEWAAELGGFGLFLIAALDSSFLSFPQVNDILVIALSIRHPALMPYYAGMTVLGSLVGCFMLYGVARKGGEVFLRKRFKAGHVDRGLALYQRYGLLAIVVPSLLPPPTPFKLFVLLAGAAAVPPWKFALAIGIGRSIRYGVQGYLAVLYGERALELVRAHSAEVGIGLAVAILAGVIIYSVLGRRRAAGEARQDPTDDSRNTSV